MSDRVTTDQVGETNSQHSNPGVLTNQSIAMGRLRNRLILGGVIGVLVLGSAVAINSGILGSATNDGSEDSAIGSEVRKLPVRVQPAEYVENISQKRLYTGIVRSKQTADLGFELTGRVQQVLVDEGDIVDQGQTLARLDTKSLEVRKASTVASLNQARAVLAELQAGPRQQTIDSMRAQWDEANSSYKLSEINLERRKRLKLDGAISESEFDEALYSHQAATARLESLSNQLNELESGTRQERLTAQAAAVVQLESQVNEISVQIEKSSIVAPFSGKIVQRMADAGGIATVSKPILKIVDVNNLEAVVGIPVETAAPMNLENKFDVRVAGNKYESKLIAKIQQLDAATRTQNLIFKFEPPANESVIAGQLCQIEVATSVDADGYWVPASALTNGIRGLWSLMIVDEKTSKAMRTDVQLIYTDGDRVLVDGPIEKNALVVVDGAHRIVTGQLVDAVKE